MNKFKYFSKYLAPLFGVAMLLSAALPAQASALTPTQVSAIIQLLQSFGADQSTIANVQVALGGSPTPTQSCSSFADVHYGDFDNDQGGRVSQLQTFLGIPSNTFGFGTYGRKTQAAWQARCGYSGTSASLQVNGSHGPVYLNDRDPMTLTWTSSGSSSCYITNVRLSPTSNNQTQDNLATSGTVYDFAAIFNGIGTIALQCGQAGDTVVIKQLQNTSVSATIDPGSLLTTYSANPVITGTANGTSAVNISIYDSNGVIAGYNDRFTASVVNGRWSRNMSYVAPGVYTVKVYDAVGGTTLTTGTLTVNGVTQPSATIDPNSLYSTSNSPILTGTASGISEFTVELIGLSANTVNSGGWTNVVNGRWSWPFSPTTLPSGTYSVTIAPDQTSGKVLATGTLTVGSNTTQSSATITSPTTQISNNVAVSGTFSNTSASSAIVVLISQPYTGATDWNTVGGYLQGTSYAMTPSGNKLYSYSTAVTGANHQFSVGFSGTPPGSYTVLVYTGTYYSQTFLTQGTLTVQ